MRWPEGPPHLALNPLPFCFGLVVFLGSGEVARRATSLGPKPSFFYYIFVLFVFFFSFLSLLVIDKKPCFPPRKGHFSLFLECLPLFLRCFSLVLFFLSSFPSLFFAFFLFPWFCLFLSFFFLFLSSLLLYHERNNIKILNCKVFSSILSFFGFAVLFFSYLFFFPDFKLCLLFNINVFGFKKHKLKNTNLGSRGGLQQNGFITNLCFAKCEKLSFFCCPFLGQILVWC